MNWRKLLHPRYGLWILIALAFFAVLALWLIKNTYEGDLSLFLNLSVGAFSAFLGARVALWIYWYLALDSQDRRFRHDLEVRHFEDIYGPLYEETGKAVRELEEYDVPSLQRWRDLKRGRFGPFVDSRIAKELNALEAELETLRKLATTSRRAAEKVIERAFRSHPLAQKLSQNDARNLRRVLMQDNNQFLFDPDKQEPIGYIVDRIREALGRVAPPVREGDAEGVIRHVKGALSSSVEIQERAAKTDAILPLAKATHEMILRRMRPPFKTRAEDKKESA